MLGNHGMTLTFCGSRGGVAMKDENTVVISLEIDDELKTSAETILRDKYGLALEDAIILFIKECVRQGRIPFEY